jgi:NADPH-dependent 2,4-dienoyl-CoA reductase/sulfur reductase-like enzyme
LGSADRVAVVGASLAGYRAAQALRRQGFDGTLTLIGGEPHAPYDRPPLSKQLLAGAWTVDQIALTTDDQLAGLELDLRLGTRATDLDVGANTLRLHGGEPIVYDHLVVATGAAARTLPGLPDLDGIVMLRTLDDSLRLRELLTTGQPRVVVVGGGFIGAEVAATSRGLGLDVTILEALPVPLERGLGPKLGAAVAAIHGDHGVDLRCGVVVDEIVGRTRAEQVVLSDGTRVDADVVVVGIGAFPTTGWLEASGLDIRDGVVCDSTCRAVNTSNVWAAGDVARWEHPLLGGDIRLEHWDNAARQGAQVATNIAATMRGEAPQSFGPVPYVWSEQYGVMIQVLGHPHADDEVDVVLGSVDERSFVALLGRDGALTAVVGVGDSRTMRFRKRLEAGATIETARAAAAELA